MILARASRVEGGPCSKCSRLSAAHIRSKISQELHRWKAVRLHHVALALAPRTFAFEVCKRFKDLERLLFNMWLSPQRRAHSS
eukprot:2340882-Pyramimonas_sp.AAC.1